MARPSSSTVDVVDDAHAVAEPLGAAELHGLPDRRQPEGLAGVDRDVEVLRRDELEGVEVAGGRVAGLAAGDVEADHAGVAVAHGQLGDLGGVGGVAHGRDDRADRERRCRRCRGGSPRRTASTTSSSVRPVAQVLLGREAHLGVDDAVGGEVLGALLGHPDEGVLRLHHADGVVERLEVEHEVLPGGALGEPAR